MAAGAACLGVGVFWLIQHLPENYREKRPDENRRKISTTRLEPIREERSLTLPMGDGTGLKIAMDEVCVRDAQGMETFVKLDPPATPASIRRRMVELAERGEVLPVAYPEHGERNEETRAIITRKLRVQLPETEGGAVAAGNGLDVTERPAYAPGWTIMEAEDPFAALAAIEGVRSSPQVASADVLVAKQRFKRVMPNDPLISQQWYLKNSTTSPSVTHINVEGVWKYGQNPVGQRGAGVSIGIVDDGVQLDHPDLNINIDTVNDYDWNANDFDSSPSFVSDIHGTAVAGVIGALADNGLGVAGIAPEAKLVGMRLISASTTDQQEAEAMAWRNEIIQVKNNSWGPQDTGRLLEAPGPLTTSALQNAVTSGRDGKGTIFVWAGGNGRPNGDNSNYDGYANRIQTIAVGAIDSNGGQADYSESGANLMVVSPSDGVGGLGIVTTDRTGTPGWNTASGISGNYTTLSGNSSFGGTSSAAPVVAGVVALMLQRNPALGWRDVQEILIRSAVKVQPADSDWQTNGANLSFNHKFGAGLVDATAAVGMAATWENLANQSKRTINSVGSDVIPEGGSVTRTLAVSGDTHRIEAVSVTVKAFHSRRGELAITLTSPSGMKSRLSESHFDPNANINEWTFSTVRNWGEFTGGNWTLQVTDGGSINGFEGTTPIAGNTTGGTLEAVTLEFHGVSTGPMNPAPQVQITSPMHGQPFSPGSTVPVTVNATDLTMIGSPGTVAQVELLMDGLPVGVDTTAPYQFSVSPTDGPHTLVARAIDLEGEVGTSPAVQIFLQNQPPVINSVILSATGQSFADTNLVVSTINAIDPEGGVITFDYQWQSSTDDRIYTNQSGQTTDTLVAAPANVGKLWRCIITPKDGTNIGIPFETSSVNIVKRPPLFAKIGTAVQHDSGLVIQGTEEPINRRIIINEVSQGTGGGREWVELLVLKQGSLVGIQLGNTAQSLVFKDIPLWQNVPAGKLIIIYQAYSKDTSYLPADNANMSAGPLVIPHLTSGSNPVTSPYFDNANNSLFPLNEDEIITLSDESGDIHRMTFGVPLIGSPSGIVPAPLGAPALGKFLATQSAAFKGGFEADASVNVEWELRALTNVSPGAGNSQKNIDFINRVVSQNLIEIPPYRLSEGTILPAGLTLNTTTGRLSGSIGAGAALGDYSIGIERYNKDEEFVVQVFTLRVFASSYNQWIGSFPGVAPGVGGDGDTDGVPNLVEYALDRNPAVAETSNAYTLGKEEGIISLTYRQSKVPGDVTLVPEWSTALDGSLPWQTGGVQIDILQEDTMSKVIKASLGIGSGDPRRFLRLKATLTP